MSNPEPKRSTIASIRIAIGLAIVVLSLCYMTYLEIALGNKTSEEYEIVKDAYILPNDKKVIKAFNRDIVLLRSEKVTSHPTYAPIDAQFEMHFGSQLELKRVVEYCQWKEYKPLEGSTETKPTYSKEWVSSPIDSSNFTEPEGHWNDLRAPFPEHTILPKYTQAGAFRISYAFYKDLNLPFIRYSFKPDDIKSIPVLTKQNGFYFASSSWIYSKVEMKGIGEPLKADGVQWMTKEQEFELEQNCKPGDIRVAFEYKHVPSSMTIVGVQNDDIILPIRKVSGMHAISAPGNVTSEEILTLLQGEEGENLYYTRIACGCGVFLGMLLTSGLFYPFRYLPHLLRCVFTTLLAEYGVCLGIWIFYYGFDNKFVYRTLMWMVMHLVLAVLSNVMFYMIRLYRFAMKLQKEKKD